MIEKHGAQQRIINQLQESAIFEIMNKKLTNYENDYVVRASATASYAFRYGQAGLLLQNEILIVR